MKVASLAHVNKWEGDCCAQIRCIRHVCPREVHPESTLPAPGSSFKWYWGLFVSL